MNIFSASISKDNLNHENQIILSMITNGEEWHYLAAKKTIYIIWKNNVIFVIFIV